MMIRLLRQLFTAEVLGLVLTLSVLQVIAYGIGSSLRSSDSVYFFWVCLLAALITFGLSKRRVNGIHAAVGMLALGILGIWVLGARLSSPLLALANAVESIIPQLIPSIRSHTAMDTTSVSEAWLVIADASRTLSLRIQTWLLGFNKNVTVNDPLVRNMIWTLIIWQVSAWMGWFAAKRNAIVALLPSMLLLAAITSYSEYMVWTLWLVVFILLLLLGLWNYRNHTAQWETRRVDYSDSIRYDMGQAAVLLTLVIGLLALITPSVSWRTIRDWLRRPEGQNEVAEVLGVQPPPRAAATKMSGPKPSLPREHLLSGGFAQSEDIVMTIRTGELSPAPSPFVAVDAPRYYWRSTTYDTYMGAGWVSSYAAAQSLQANTPVIPGLLNGYKALHLDVDLSEPEGKLFWSGILFSADVPFRADWRLKPQSSLFADQSALLQADLFAAVSTAHTYQAEAYVSLASEEELRLASTDYPDYIQTHYLQLPSSLPARVRQLAREITKGKSNAYDKAKAIESYLRTYPYTLEVAAPPADRDVADYFLFDLRKGYCDYYATAMVVLARASGIPARFVSGYSPGSYDAATAQYIVRELNAHSWAEIYFPEIGWIEFEPTASQPEIERIPSKGDTTSTPPSDSAAERLLNRFRLIKAAYLFSPIAFVMFAIALYFTLIERWVYLRLAPSEAIEKTYRRLFRLGRPLAGERTRAETADEFQQKLVSRIKMLKKDSRFAKLFAGAQQDVELLTDLYQGTLFGERIIQKKDARKTLSIWRHLRVRLLLIRVLLLASSRSLALRPSHFDILTSKWFRNARS